MQAPRVGAGAQALGISCCISGCFSGQEEQKESSYYPNQHSHTKAALQGMASLVGYNACSCTFL